MTFIERIKSYHKSKIREEQVLNKKWFLFKWEIVLVIGLALFAVILNQIPVWVVKPINGVIDPIHSYPLANGIVYSSISMFLIIAIAIFIGVFTEIGKMAGKYGAAVFILVPAFVWLLSEREDEHLTRILETGRMIGEILFWTVVGIAIAFIVATFLKMLSASFAMALSTKLKIELFYNYFSRTLVVLINVLIVLLVSYAFINYALLSLHLADVTPADKLENPALEVGNYNLEKQSFKVFHVVITVVFSVLMVLIGLSTSFTESIRGEAEEEPEWGFIEKEEKEEEKLEDKEDIIEHIIDIKEHQTHMVHEHKEEISEEHKHHKEVTHG